MAQLIWRIMDDDFAMFAILLIGGVKNIQPIISPL